MRCRSRLGRVRSSMVLRKRRNSRCRWRGMHWPMTVPSSMLRAANSRGAIALVVMRHRPAAALLHRQPRLGAVERLDLAFFIDRQHQGFVGWIEVKADDILDLGDEVRIA